MWLRNIKDVYRLHADELNAIEDQDRRADKLTELNVKEQIMHLAKTSIIQKAWRHEQRPQLHGWVYGLANGILKPIITMDANDPIDDLYVYDDI